MKQMRQVTITTLITGRCEPTFAALSPADGVAAVTLAEGDG